MRRVEPELESQSAATGCAVRPGSTGPGLGSGELSWRYQGEHPRTTWTDDEIVDYYDNRFETQIVDGRRQRVESGRAGTTRFWVMTFAAVRRLLERDPNPGVDYALTEVVRCKSRKEIGVREALGTCSQRWFERTLERSPAPVILVLGNHAKAAFLHVVPEAAPPSGSSLSAPVTVGGCDRLVAFLRHPSAAGGTRIDHLLGDQGLAALRLALSEAESARV
jgi:hypothetical protein